MNKGISASLLEQRGFGEAKPLVDSDAPAALKQNRRVEFEVEFGGPCSKALVRRSGSAFLYAVRASRREPRASPPTRNQHCVRARCPKERETGSGPMPHRGRSGLAPNGAHRACPHAGHPRAESFKSTRWVIPRAFGPPRLAESGWRSQSKALSAVECQIGHGT